MKNTILILLLNTALATSAFAGHTNALTCKTSVGEIRIAHSNNIGLLTGVAITEPSAESVKLELDGRISRWAVNSGRSYDLAIVVNSNLLKNKKLTFLGLDVAYAGEKNGASTYAGTLDYGTHWSETASTSAVCTFEENAGE